MEKGTSPVKSSQVKMRAPLAISLLSFFVILLAIALQVDRLPEASKTAKQAYFQLQEVAKSPHPYNSHRNDKVRAYISDYIHRVCPLAVDESNQAAVWLNGQPDVKVPTYHEQTNLVIYLPSTAKGAAEMDAVLLSAHYDSVSSGNGATDNGMAVTVVMALIERYCNHSLPSNLVFNINNAEEDGLFGAHAFVEHPRAAEVKSFVNLEGAGAGGPAMMFRASGAEVADAYLGAKLPRCSIAGNDFFEQHLVQSQTDFVAYDPYFPGLDIAFFSPRSLYHTRRDSSATTSAQSIEHMLSAADSSLRHLSSTKRVAKGKSKKPFFFDSLGLTYVSLSLDSLLWFNLFTLILAPIILGVSFSIRSYFGKVKLVGIGRTFGALLLQILFVVGVSVLIVVLNPFIIYSSPLLYATTILFASFAANLFATRTFMSRIRDQHDLSRVISWELAQIWYIVLFVSTIVSFSKGIGSTYIVTINFLAAFLVALISLFERTAYVPPITRFETRESDRESTESTPLLRDPLPDHQEVLIRREKQRRDYRSAATWIFKFIVLVPVPALVSLWLLFSTVLPSLSQTAADGSNPNVIYTVVAVFAVLTFFNLAPFFLSTTLQTAFPALLFVLSILTITSVLKAPFNGQAPLKVYFKQVVDLDTSDSHVEITGLYPYMPRAIETLSLAKDGLHCGRGSTRSKALWTCTFPVPIDERITKAGISFERSKSRNETTSKQQTIIINSSETRICDITTERPVRVVSISGKTVDETLDHWRMYRRDWNKPFKVVLSAKAKGTAARVTCFLDDRTDHKIAAFETVEAELPEWVTLTKRDTGLLWYSKAVEL